MLTKKTGARPHNILIMYISAVFGGMLFFLPILALYFEKHLFTVTNIAWVFSIEAVAVVLFEAPTGAIADLFGRKLTMMLDYAVTLLSITFLYIGGSMYMFVAYAVCNALAMSLSSGAENALIYDTLKEEGREHDYKKVIGIYYALWPAGGSIAAVIGGYLAESSLRAPIFASFFPVVIALVLLFFIKEPFYIKDGQKNIFKHIFISLKTVTTNTQLTILFVGGFLLYAFSETIHLLNPLFFKFKEIPIVYFGYIFALSLILSSFGLYLSHTISKRFGNKKTLIILVLLLSISTIMATLTHQYIAALLLIIPSFFVGLRNPIINHMINIEVASNQRATVNSLSNLANKVGIIIFAPLVGYLAELYTINTAFQISGILLIAIPLIFLPLREKC
ncbi:MAG: MFS transporter [Parcubacteria group bacterium]|jgi:MFS family permease